MASYNEAKQVGEVERSFRAKLTKIALEINTGDKLPFLLFACKEIIPDATRDNITTPVDLFQELERRGKLSPKNRGLLGSLLREVGLGKLSQDLEESNSSLTSQTLQKVTHEVLKIKLNHHNLFLSITCIFEYFLDVAILKSKLL
jgi:hypothetical protein